MRLQCLLVAAIALLPACRASDRGQPAPDATLAQALDRVGFTEVALPSTAYGPGSIVTSRKGYGLQPPLRLAYICGPEFAAAPAPLVDAAASREISRSLKGGVRLDAAGIASLGLGAEASYLDSVTLIFSNVRVEQQPYENLDLIRDSLGPRCAASLADFRSKGIAYQTVQAFRADVEYKVDFKAGASAGVKNAVISVLTGSFGGSVEKTAGDTLQGKGLYYGLNLREL